MICAHDWTYLTLTLKLNNYSEDLKMFISVSCENSNSNFDAIPLLPLTSESKKMLEI